MPLTIQVWDEAIHGERSPARAITIPDARTTARELIRTRIRLEVERYNLAEPGAPPLLIQPEQEEQILNGIRERRPLDGEIQFLRACSSFRRNGFLLFVDGLQVTDLDIPLALQPESQVQFVKLVPLVGG
jgi:hypothetical protein